MDLTLWEGGVVAAPGGDAVVIVVVVDWRGREGGARGGQGVLRAKKPWAGGATPGGERAGPDLDVVIYLFYASALTYTVAKGRRPVNG